MSNGIIGAASYFPQETLSDAKMKREQLMSARAARGMQEAQQAGLMAAYGSSSLPDMYYKKAIADKEAADEAMHMKRMQHGSDLMDSFYDVASKSNFNPEVIKGIQNDPRAQQAVAPLGIDLSTWMPHGEGEDIVLGEDKQGVLDGQPHLFKAGSAVTKAHDGSLSYRIKTADDVAKMKKATTAGAKPTDPLQWDKASNSLLLKLQGTTTASGIMIDPARQAETMLAASLLNKYRNLDVNTAVIKALEEAREMTGNFEPVKIPKSGEVSSISPKTAKDYLENLK